MRTRLSPTGNWRPIWLVVLGMAGLLSGCARGQPAQPAAWPTPTLMSLGALPTPLLMRQPQTPQPEPLPTVRPSPAPVAPRYTLGSAGPLPADLLLAAQTLAAQQPALFGWTGGAGDVRLALNQGEPLATWVFAAATAFASLTDDVTLAEVQAAWRGEGGWGLVVDETTADLLAALLGAPGAGVTVVQPAALVETVWARRAEPALTLLPFERLTPELKVLRLDGQSPLDVAFAPDGYPLALPVGLLGSETAAAALRAHWPGPASNWDPARLTRVAMTGVTALVRATAQQMELNGVLYPGTAVAPLLQAADIAHLSNEVAFAADCPYPDPFGGTTFCSRESYFALLESLGIDVVEVTGNHVNDWGRAAFAATLDRYAAAGMASFGGGRNLAAAAEPALLTHHGNAIAFVGCNPVGPASAWATADAAGARPCDDGFAAQLAALRAAGYVVLATLQYQEYYHYAPTAQQQADFARLADAGAAAVSGSQGHHAQGFAFHHGAFIHYGLGNLFFDQMDMLGTRQSFIDTYVIYDGRLISVQLWTGLIENYARPREMTPAERQQLLEALFAASGW